MKKLFAMILFVALTLLSASLICAAAEPSVSVPVTDDNVYKNLYSVNETVACENDGAVAQEYDSLSGNIDSSRTAYIAFAIYAPEAGDYSFKLVFDGADYAAVRTGDTLIKAFKNETFTLGLTKGLNLITCFGAVKELNDSKITYTELICENGLNPIEGSFYFTGDANEDMKVDIRDLVRYKKYFAGVSEIKTSVADLDDDGSVETADMIILRQYFLGAKSAQNSVLLKYELTNVTRDNDLKDNWNY